MKKEEFLKKLNEKLIEKRIAERYDIVAYYEELIDGRVENGLIEEEVIANFGSVDTIVMDVIDEGEKEKIFTYSDFIEARSSKYEESDQIKFVHKFKKNTQKIDISENYSLDLNIFSRRINVSSKDVDSALISFYNHFLMPIRVYKKNNEITIQEKASFSFISVLLYFVFFIGGFFLFRHLLFSLLESSKWWYFLVVFLASIFAHIPHIPEIIFYLTKRDVFNIYLPKNIMLNSITVIAKSG